MRSLYFLVLLLSLSLVVDVDAGWKFWKKKKNDTSTEDPLSSTSPATTSTTTAASRVPAKPKQGIAAAADPALAIGVGSVGDKIREDARGQPRRPNPGTDVGLDISKPKPGLGGASGQGYRDWAADLTGAGDSGRVSPKLPTQGPALSAGDNRPASVPGTPTSGHQPSVAPGTRPVSAPSTPTAQQPAIAPGTRPASVPGAPSVQLPGSKPSSAPGSPIGQPSAVAPGNRPSSIPGTPTGHQTPNFGSIDGKSSTPAAGSHSTPGPKPALHSSTPAPHQTHDFDFPQLGHQGRPDTKPTTPRSPTNVPQRSWADVAGGGSRPGSPTSVNPSQPTNTRGSSGGHSPVGPSNLPVGAAGAAIAAGSAVAATAGKYSSNPTYSKGKGVTDEDLEKLSEALFIKDTNNAYKYITMNLQKTTTGNSPKDEAPEPLFQVKQEAFQIPTIQKVLSIYDNYKLDTRENEYISPAQRQEESLLVDTFLSTNVMSAAMRFLADKGFVKKDYYEYKDRLRTIWFNLYSRGEGKIGSTGFEHVFMNELKLGNEVSGLHNWIYFNAEELKKRLDYLGYIKKVDLGNKAAIVKAHVKFNGIDKPATNVFVGTSPELEMALYTVCFFARPDALCPLSLGGTKFNVQTHKFKYRGKDLVGSAYPEI